MNSETHTILHVAETVKGGIATYINNFFDAQNTNDNFRMILISPFSQKDEIKANPHITTLYYKDYSNRLLNSLLVCLKTLFAIKKYKPKIVHLHSFFAGVFLRPILLFFKIKIIYCPHGWSFDRDSSFLSKKVSIFIETILALIDQKIICISDHERNIAIKKGISKENLLTIKNAIPVSFFQNKLTKEIIWPENRLKILFVGRLDKQKGIDILLDAVYRIERKIHVIVVGSDVLSDSKNIPKYSKKLENVDFVGWKNQNELLEYYHSADLIVIPSRWEGFGLVAIEAMSCKLPVIASRVGGLAEIIIDRETGRLFDPNSFKSLRKIINEVSNEELKNMSEQSFKRVRDFYDISRLNEEMNTLYLRLIENN